MDGNLFTKGPPQPKIIYSGPEGEIGLAVVHELLWITARYDLDLRKKENLLRVVALAEEAFEALRQKGVKYLYCMAETYEAIKFNQVLGFKQVNATLHDKYEVMEKEL